MTHARGNRIAALSPMRLAGAISRQPLALLVGLSMLAKIPVTALDGHGTGGQGANAWLRRSETDPQGNLHHL
jgi:hypothetical protein